MIVTVTVTNLDDKLKQMAWHIFIIEFGDKLVNYADTIYFEGGTASWAMQQRVAFVIKCEPARASELQEKLKQILGRYKLATDAMLFVTAA